MGHYVQSRGGLSVQTAVTLVAEFLGRLVCQSAVWTDGVELAPEARGLCLRVRRRLECHTLQELVPEPAVERLDQAVLPRTARCDLDRLRPLARQPAC